MYDAGSRNASSPERYTIRSAWSLLHVARRACVAKTSSGMRGIISIIVASCVRAQEANRSKNPWDCGWGEGWGQIRGKEVLRALVIK